MDTVITILGMVYLGLLAAQPLLMFGVKLTKTDKDNVIVAKVYDILKTYGPDIDKILAKFKK